MGETKWCGFMGTDEVDTGGVLEEIDASTPSRLRREVVGRLQKLAGADAALFSKYSLSDGGEYDTSVEVLGDEQFAREFEDREGNGCQPARTWDPRYPPKESEQSFHVEHYPPGTLAEDSQPKALCDVYREVGVRWEASALLYDGPRFLGWLAFYRLRDAAFEPERIERLNELVGSIVRELSRAERLESELLGDRPARVLMDPSTLDVECATGNAFDWLTEPRKEQLTEEIAELDLGESFPIKLFIDGFRVWVTQMSGQLGMRLLATIERAPAPEKRPEAALTPRQREVVGYAAAGATNREIAETLNITPDTVSDHLSAAYRRLGVANRVELALTLTSETDD